MHEGAIAESIVDIIKQTALINKLERITTVRLRIGKLSGVMVDALLFALDALKNEEPLIKDAVFDVENVAIRARCLLCSREFCFKNESDIVLICPYCNMPLDIVDGKQMEIIDIEGE
ncbi:hydrogenase maturation nickel metallochaperone HypA [Hippea maritima]|uniref:Hydrogenase maturation factor HypA n=1 Tax=Hippea maritima (strain ATCC 700847 / DSM 10411 / MH2) TaxID=760142 RepID=F2LWC6_HIPMA|nr:hydrogenase maturation nickel metallochaperone HypA [Hippea maritima]AEA34060.1 hydrogenase expression/synthesis HypA [Hippea maritima DSM 10411]